VIGIYFNYTRIINNKYMRRTNSNLDTNVARIIEELNNPNIVSVVCDDGSVIVNVVAGFEREVAEAINNSSVQSFQTHDRVQWGEIFIHNGRECDGAGCFL
jgi:hypothetical protein